MLPYLLVLSFVMFWMILEQKATNRKAFWVPFITLSLFAGVRSYLVGTDSGNYARSFVKETSIYNYKFSDNVEFGYQLFEYNLLKITHNYFWLFFLTALIIVGCYLKTIKKYSVNYEFSVFLFITLGTYTFFFNGLRQGIAMAVFVLATPYLLEKRLIPYLVITVIASFFHATALFMIPFYFLVNININSYYKVFLSFFVSLIGSRFIVSEIASTNPRYGSYAKPSEESGGLITLGFYTIIILLLYAVRHLYKIKNEEFEKLLSFYAMGIVFVIPIAMLGTNASGPQRLIGYFSWSLILLLPIALKKINNFYIYFISILLFLSYFILTTSRFSNLTPYLINSIFEAL